MDVYDMGFSFEEIEWLKPCVESIDQTEIKFNEKIENLSDARKSSIAKFIFKIELILRTSHMCI